MSVEDEKRTLPTVEFLVFKGRNGGIILRKDKNGESGMYGEFLSTARKKTEKYVKIYRQLHKNPEQNMHLPNTLKLCKDHLCALGYAPKELGGGIVATVGRGERCILLRADMDALPVKEESGLDYASDNGMMHACGHDMHTVMLLLAAEILKEREKDLSCTVKLCFQAGEETLTGARTMIEKGLLNDPAPDFGIMIHVLAATDFETGTVIVPPSGVGAAGVDFFRITVNGKGCHGSTPHLGRDPIMAISAVVTALGGICSRELPSGGGDVLTLGQIKVGDSPNVIPEKGEIFGSLRSYEDEHREFLKERLSSVCENIAKAYRCEGKAEYLSGAPSFINDKELTKCAAEVFASELSHKCVVLTEGKGGGSEDFAYVSREIPSLMLCISAGSKEEGYTQPLHSPRVRFNEDTIPYGAAAYALAAFELV